MVAKKRATSKHRTVASNLCRHFDETVLAGCSRAGLTCLEAHHKPIITCGAITSCGVAFDTCRKPHDPDENRWDYVFGLRDLDDSIAVEVHPTTAENIDEMIAKKEWTSAFLERECPELRVIAWLWVAPPPKSEILLLRHGPNALRLAEAGIAFPIKAVQLP